LVVLNPTPIDGLKNNRKLTAAMTYNRPLLKQKSEVAHRQAILSYIPAPRLSVPPSLRPVLASELRVCHHFAIRTPRTALAFILHPFPLRHFPNIYPLPCISPCEALSKSGNSFRAHNLRPTDSQNFPPKNPKRETPPPGPWFLTFEIRPSSFGFGS